MSHQRTVYVIDQDLQSRRSITGFLASIGAEAWPFPSGAEFIEILDHLMPACILLDMEISKPTGLEMLGMLSARQSGWPVVALSGRPDVRTAVQAMKLGALDFLEKPVSPAILSAALIPAWSALERSVEAAEARRSAQERVARLTPREIDIALALLSGRPNKGVAHDLGISVRTVEMHRAHIMTKLGVKSLAEAAMLASQAGVLVPPSGGAAGARETRAAAIPLRALPPPTRSGTAPLLGRRSLSR
jgi:two-component system, LuxR family, response regulator FixJ